ncbi:ATP-binding protein [Amycolatopsis magusensis]|uniref:ATP-binding protein n=1 Tax=Amycolatopsis magusensis TaxID=882444 RepID=UPI00379930BC
MRRTTDVAGHLATLGLLTAEVDLLPPLLPTTGPSVQAFRHREDATPMNASQLRGLLNRWLRGLGLTGDLLEDVVLAAYEAMANVVDHAYAGEPGPLDLHAHAHAGTCTITIADQGRWRTAPPTSGSFRGRGLGMMHELSNEVLMRSNERGTTVRMIWRDAYPA